MSTQNSALTSLETKSVIELKELLERQNKILKNTSFIAKLKDKGAKLHSARDRIEIAIKEAEIKGSQKESSKMLTSPDDLEWSTRLMKLMNINISKLDEQVGTGRNSSDCVPIPLNMESSSKLDKPVDQKTSMDLPPPNPESVSHESPNNSIFIGPEVVYTQIVQSDDILHIKKCVSQNDSSKLQAKFKPSHSAKTICSSIVSEPPKPTAQIAKQLRWDEALLPPSSTNSVKQLSWEESFAELRGTDLKRKERIAESNLWKNKPYAFKDLPGSSLNPTLMSKNNIPDFHDRVFDNDYCIEDEDEDRITEESETEE